MCGIANRQAIRELDVRVACLGCQHGWVGAVQVLVVHRPMQRAELGSPARWRHAHPMKKSMT
eukprot:5094028-Heterocapsa_arctica.AAC.1